MLINIRHSYFSLLCFILTLTNLCETVRMKPAVSKLWQYIILFLPHKLLRWSFLCCFHSSSLVLLYLSQTNTGLQECHSKNGEPNFYPLPIFTVT